MEKQTQSNPTCSELVEPNRYSLTPPIFTILDSTSPKFTLRALLVVFAIQPGSIGKFVVNNFLWGEKEADFLFG